MTRDTSGIERGPGAGGRGGGRTGGDEVLEPALLRSWWRRVSQTPGPGLVEASGEWDDPELIHRPRLIARRLHTRITGPAQDLVDAVDQAVRVAVRALDEIDADASVVAVNIATAQEATRRHDHADGGPAGAGTGKATTSFDP